MHAEQNSTLLPIICARHNLHCPATAVIEEEAFPHDCVVTRRTPTDVPGEGGAGSDPRAVGIAAEVQTVFADDEKGLAEYMALFSKPGVLNEEGSNIVAKAEAEASQKVLGAVLGAKATGEDAAKLVIDAPIKGFYYALVQQGSLPSRDVKIDQKLAGRDDMVFGLTKWPSSGYYRMIVSPTPVSE